MNETEAQNVRLYFGKFTQQALEDIPSSYLRWVDQQEWFHTKYQEEAIAVNLVLRWRNRFNEHFEIENGQKVKI